MIELGSKVRDKVTGFTGIALGRSVWLYADATVGLVSGVGKDGKRVNMEWFEESRLVVVKAKKKAAAKKKAKATPKKRKSRRESTVW